MTTPDLPGRIDIVRDFGLFVFDSPNQSRRAEWQIVDGDNEVTGARDTRVTEEGGELRERLGQLRLLHRCIRGRAIPLHLRTNEVGFGRCALADPRSIVRDDGVEPGHHVARGVDGNPRKGDA